MSTPRSFSFFETVAHHAPHSFPTRRSSDLMRPGLGPDRGDGPAILADSARMAGPSRSEEHTSELQSRFDLVCRLLHEKKNGTCTPARRSCVTLPPTTSTPSTSDL